MAASIADELRALDPAELRRRVALLTPAEAEALIYDWTTWARPEQLTPGKVNPRTADGAWIVWMILAGRGFGKTRTGAETVRRWIREGEEFVNLIGATADDARDIMVEGESGILAICPKDERPIYLPSKRRLEWPNGAKSLIFTADEPERLRGKQHGKLWGDELAAWRYPEAWDQASFGLRLGQEPQAVITTTPKPTALVKALVADPTTLVTKGSTYDNKANLARNFIAKIVTKYEGTRLGRQELNAEILDDNPGALWHLGQIDATRVETAPELVRVGVGVDPAVTSKEDSDLTGIIVAGRDRQNPPHFYILEDRSLIATPDAWAQAVVGAYRTQKADRVVAEVNNGGDMVETILRHRAPDLSFTAVHATRGKAVRAEPIAALYEQGRVHHVGTFGPLEDQMTDWDPVLSEKSPDRVDALVWVLTHLSEDSGGQGVVQWYSRKAKELREAKKA